MTFADSIRGIETVVMTQLSLAQAAFARRRDYNRTFNELSKLSDRELDDMGIGRGQIAVIARVTTEGN